MERLNWSRTRDILISIICIGIILWYAWGLLLGLFVHAVVLLLLSMAVAFLLTPAVNYLQKNNMPRVIATLVMYAVVLIALGGVSYALVKSLIQQVLTFQVTLVDYANALPDRFTAFQKFLVDNGIPQSSINDALNQIRGQATAFATTLANNVLNIGLSLRDSSYGWANTGLYACYSSLVTLARAISTYLLDYHLLCCCSDDRK